MSLILQIKLMEQSYSKNLYNKQSAQLKMPISLQTGAFIGINLLNFTNKVNSIKL